MLPLGFFLAFSNVPFIFGFGEGGPCILAISFIKVFRLGDWKEAKNIG